MQKMIMIMNSIPNNSQFNGNIYNGIAQVQSVYSQYIQLRTQLNMLDNRMRLSNEEFNRIPTHQNCYAVQNIWDQKLLLMQKISDIVNSIVVSLTE